MSALYSYRALKLLTSTLLVVAILGVSCGCSFISNDADSSAPETAFTATLNGESWSAVAQPGSINRANVLTIVGRNFSSDSYWRESLAISVLFRGTGLYSLARQERGDDLYGGSYFEADADVLLATYIPQPDSATNYVRVTSYDPNTGIMEGRFRTTVVVSPEDRLDEPGEPPRRRADTLRFTDGSFRVVVDDLR